MSHSSRASPSEAAAIAALTRSTAYLSLAASDSKPMYWESKLWQRLIDDQLIAKTTKTLAIESLEIILSILERVKALPYEGQDGTERVRTVRLRNPIIKRTIVDVPGAYDLLLQCGFKRLVVDFEERLTLPCSSTPASFSTVRSRLSTSIAVVGSSLSSLRQRLELERVARDAANDDKDRRMRHVLEAIKDDRARLRAEHERRKKKE